MEFLGFVGAITYASLLWAIGISLIGRHPRLADLSSWAYPLVPAIFVIMMILPGWTYLIIWIASAVASIFLGLLTFIIAQSARRCRFIVSALRAKQQPVLIHLIENTLALKGSAMERGSKPVFGGNARFLVGPVDEGTGLAWVGFEEPLSREEVVRLRRAIRTEIPGMAWGRSTGFAFLLLALGLLFAYLSLLIR